MKNQKGIFHQSWGRGEQSGGQSRVRGSKRGHQNFISHPPDDEVCVEQPTGAAVPMSFQSSSPDDFSQLLSFLPRSGLYGAAMIQHGYAEGNSSEDDDDDDEGEIEMVELVVAPTNGDVERGEERPDEDDDEDEDEKEVGDGDEEEDDGDTDEEETLHDDEFAAVDVSGDDKDLLLTSSKDTFFLRFSGSTDGVDTQLADAISAEAALKASRVIMSIDLAPSVIPVESIGANPESADGTFLHGGAINVHVSASVGAAADEMTDVFSMLGARRSRKGTNSFLYSVPHVDLTSSTGGCINKSLAKAWQSTYGSEPANSFLNLPSHNTLDPPLSQNLTPLQFSLWHPLSSYRDIHFTLRSFDNAREVRTLSALHVASHLLKARNLVSGHDRQIKEALLRMEELKRDKLLKKDALKQAKRSERNGTYPREEEGHKSGDLRGNSALSVSVPEFRDQGFSRPRVLVLLPHRHSALLFVRSLIRLLTEGSEMQVENRRRFCSEFSGANEGGTGENVDEEEEVELSIEKDSVKAVLSKVPRAVREMMSDDEFENDETFDAVMDSENGEKSHSIETYPFSKHRQGWPRHLKKKLEHARSIQRHSIVQRNETDSDNDDDDEMDDDTSLMKRRRGGGGRGRKRHKADRTDRSLSALQKESILGSIAAYEATLAKKAKALERKAIKREREKQYTLLNPVPKDFKKTFTGNIDDDFKLGISLSARQIKLFSPFYESDLIVASPLGLRRVMGGEGEASREIDFLSSIEVVIVDEADLLLQQNWQHVKDIFSALNMTPLSPQNTDFSRVREGDLAGTLRFNRQTLIYSSYADAEFSSLMKRSCYNAIGGQVMFRAGGYRGSVSRVVSAIRQSFVDVSTACQTRASLKTVTETDDARLEAFKSLVLPLLKPRRSAGEGEEKSAQQPHTLIFIPSYFDYVRLRNLLDAKEVEFSTCSEYSDDKDIATSRKSFRRGDPTTILVTERFHFFRRVKFLGVKHVVFYGPPRVAHSYAEVLDWIEEKGSEKREEGTLKTSLLLYSKFDGLQLERICGSQRASSLLR